MGHTMNGNNHTILLARVLHCLGVIRLSRCTSVGTRWFLKPNILPLTISGQQYPYYEVLPP